MPIKTLSDLQKQRVLEVNYDFDSAEKETVERCDLCGGQQFTIVAQHDRYHFRTKGILCECGNCFISPRLTENSADHFYANYYRSLISAWWGRNIDAVGIQKDQKIYTQRLIEQFDHLGIDKIKIDSIIDIGGSTGVMLSGLSEWLGGNKRLVNIDPAEKETDISISSGIETKKDFIENLNIGEKFDLVLMCWAVDHLRSIKTTLKKIRSIMHKDSYFWIDFVDFEKILNKKQSVEGSIKIDHNFNLTDVVLEEYLKVCGFKIIRKIVSMDKWHVGYVCKITEPKKIDSKKLKKHRDYLYKKIRNLNEEFEDENF